MNKRDKELLLTGTTKIHHDHLSLMICGIIGCYALSRFLNTVEKGMRLGYNSNLNLLGYGQLSFTNPTYTTDDVLLETSLVP